MMNLQVFRQYDIRGHADRDLTDELVSRLGRHLVGRLSSVPKPRIVVARDVRVSGARLRDALVKGLVAAGAQVLDVGTGPTPLMYFGVHHLEADGGVMITGSHNPGDENGFKIMTGQAPFFGEAIVALRDAMVSGEGPVEAGGAVETLNIDDAYVEALCARVSMGPKEVPFAVDAGNGAAGPLALRVLDRLGLNPTALFCEPDGRFPNHHPDPTVPENLRHLVEAMQKVGALVGLAWDGDGDRLGVVDRDGSIVWGDRLLALFARGILEAHPGASVIGDVKCSARTFQYVNDRGGNGIMWKTGHSLIKRKMKDAGALLAGEMSGHFFFRDRFYGFDDGIYAALRVLELVTAEGLTVGQLLHDLPAGHATPEIRIACPDAVKEQVVAHVRAELQGDLTDDDSVSTIDGVRISYADGAWGLVRASNTGPVLVLRAEATTEARCRLVEARLRELVDAAVKTHA